MSASGRIARGTICGVLASVVAIAAMLLVSDLAGFTNTIFLAVRCLNRSGIPPRWTLLILVMCAHVGIGGVGGALYAKANPRRWRVCAAVLVVTLVLLQWHALGINLTGWPPETARVATALTLFLTLLLFERTLALLFREKPESAHSPYAPAVTRRALLLGGIGIVATGGTVALLRNLYRVSAFRHDGLEYKGAAVKPITPRDEFYCVSENFIDPRVDSGLWHLEVDGLVQTPHTWRIQDLRGMPPTDQETTLLSSRNPPGGGLISNAIWTGVSLRELLTVASPLARAAGVRFEGVDGHSEIMSLEAAMDPDVLLAHEMNGELLPYRQGHPLRLIVPGAYGERSVKWLSNIELIGAEDMHEANINPPPVPTFGRIDSPMANAQLSTSDTITIRGVAFAGDRQISRVESSDDEGATWREAAIEYAATPMAWVVWRFAWKPAAPGQRMLSVRVTDSDQPTLCHSVSVQVVDG